MGLPASPVQHHQKQDQEWVFLPPRLSAITIPPAELERLLCAKARHSPASSEVQEGVYAS